MPVGPPWISTSSGGRLAVGADDLGVGRRVVERVGGALAVRTRGERDRLGHREPRVGRGRARGTGAGSPVAPGPSSPKAISTTTASWVEAGADEGDAAVLRRQRGDLGVRQVERRPRHRRRRRWPGGRGRRWRRRRPCDRRRGTRSGTCRRPRPACRPRPRARSPPRPPPSASRRVHVPPVGAVRDEVERAVGAPHAAGSPTRPRPPATTAASPMLRPSADEVGDEQLGGVPGHVGVVPLDPRQLRAVGRDAGAATKSGPVTRHHGLGRPVGGERRRSR